MKRKLFIAAIVATLAAVPVLAVAAEQLQPQDEWFTQMFNTHKQIVQQAVDNGTITADQAAKMNEHMQQMAPGMQQMMQNGGMMNGRMMQNSGTVNNQRQVFTY